MSNFISKKKVNIIIVNYNSWEDLLACIATLNNSSYSNFQIFIVDNNSTDNSIEEISTTYANTSTTFLNLSSKDFQNFKNKSEIDKHDIVLVRNDENGGFGLGNNIALRYLVENRDDDYTWLLNPDTEVEESVLIDLISETEHKKKTITGNVINYFSHKSKIMYYGGFRVKKYIHGVKGIISKNNIEKISAITGTSFFTHISTYKELGLFPEEYFMYWEETDFCTNAKRNGYQFNVNNKSKIYDHVGSASNTNFLREYLYLLNGLRYYRKYFPLHLITIIPSSLLKILKATIFVDKTKIKAIFWAHYDFLTLLLGKNVDIKARIAKNKNNVKH